MFTMRVKLLTPAFIAAALTLGSCSTPKNISYFQDVATGTVIDPAKQLDIKVKPEDKLSIIVTTQDPALSGLFNLVTVQNRLGQTTGSTIQVGNMGTGGSGQTAYYTVDRQGDINFPVLGELHIAGMNRYEIAEHMSPLSLPILAYLLSARCHRRGAMNSTKTSLRLSTLSPWQATLQ